MKSKLFKKAIACMCTAAMAAQLGIVMPASAAELQTATYANGKLTLPQAAETDMVAIVAKYNSDKSLDKATPTKIAAGTTEVELAAEIGDKIMVWDSLGGLVPVTNVVSVTAPKPTPKPTIDPALLKYKWDFEDLTSENYGTGWIGHTGRLSLQTDSDSAINQYVQVATAGSDGGHRAVNYTLPSEAATKDDQNYAVLEFDMKMNMNGGNRTSQLGFMSTGASVHDALKASKSATNYQGTDFVLLFTQAHDGSIYLNNGALDGQVANGGEIPASVNNKWAHVTAVLNFNEGKQSVFVIISSLDGTTEYFRGNAPMGSTADEIKYLLLVGTRNGRGSVAVDNIVVRGLSEYDVVETYYTVTYEVDGTETSESVKENEFVAKIPATVKTGYLFDGWVVNDNAEGELISTEALKTTPITAATKLTAKFSVDPDYIEPMTSLSLDVPNGGILTMGESDIDFTSNPISLSVIGELGSDLYANPDSRVNDFDVKWSFAGFRTIVANNEPTGDIKENEYCDSYAKVVFDSENPTVADFTLANQVQNYYGRVKAEVTYNGQTMTIEKPLAIIANTASHSANQLLPKAGYVADFTPYEDAMVGYQAVRSADNRSASDVATGDWAAYGGNNGLGLYLEKENDAKFMKLKSTGTNSSSFAVNNIGTAPVGQVIITQDVRFYNEGSSILYKTANPVTWNDNAVSFSLNFTGTELNIDGVKIADAEANTWYNITVISDVTSKTNYAIVKNAEGEVLGQSALTAFTNAGSTAPVYLCYRTPDNAQGELDFNNVRVYVPEVSDEGLVTIATKTELTIPDDDTADTADLTVSAKSTEGYDIIGQAVWTIVDAPEGMTVVADSSDSHKAVLSVSNEAQPGTYNIRVAMNGTTKDISVTVKGTKDSLGFTSASRSIQIPFAGDAAATSEYKASVVDKDGNDLNKTVTYKVYDADNANEITELPTGITFADGVMTVTSEAAPTILNVRALSTNTAGEVLERTVRVVISNHSYDFGTDAVAATAAGYTAVGVNTIYSDATGYGISAGTPTASGTASATDANADNLSGNFTFQAKVEPGKVYKVTMTYTGTATSERVNSDLTGVVLSGDQIPKDGESFLIPVIDGILDLSFTGGNVSSIVIEKTANKTPRETPKLFAVGDSTIANNGSWAYVLNADFFNHKDLNSLVTFANSGRGGRNLSSYYTGGELVGRVLSQIQPGDYVMIGDMGTNGMGNYFEESFNYYIDACETMGAKVILNSYTPHGPMGGYESGYNSVTNKFDSYRKDAYDVIVRGIYEERTDINNAKYDPNIIGFVDIGKMADAAFNAYVDDYETNGYSSRNAAALAIIACFSDHNHYSNARLACNLMIEGYGDGADAKGIVKSLVEIITADLAK